MKKKVSELLKGGLGDVLMIICVISLILSIASYYFDSVLGISVFGSIFAITIIPIGFGACKQTRK